MSFGISSPVMAAGEGIATMLSLREVSPALPALPAIAGLWAAHLAAIIFPPGLRRLYVARENDSAGLAAFAPLVERAIPIGIEILALTQLADDLNLDLMTLGRPSMTSIIASQFRHDDAARYRD